MPKSDFDVQHVQLEYYTLEYAESLGASQQTWPLAAEYFAWCPVHGRSSLISLLEGLPLASGPERMAMKAMQASSRMHPAELAQDLTEQISRVSLLLYLLGICHAQSMRR